MKSPLPCVSSHDEYLTINGTFVIEIPSLKVSRSPYPSHFSCNRVHCRQYGRPSSHLTLRTYSQFHGIAKPYPTSPTQILEVLNVGNHTSSLFYCAWQNHSPSASGDYRHLMTKLPYRVFTPGSRLDCKNQEESKRS